MANHVPGSCLDAQMERGANEIRFLSQPIRSTLISLVLYCLLEGSAVASDSGCSDDTTSPLAGAGLKVYVDPKTGELLDQPPPGQELPALVGPSRAAPVTQQVRPDGTVVADVGDRFVTELRAEVVDGKVVTCHRPVDESPSTDVAAGNSDQQRPSDEP